MDDLDAYLVSLTEEERAIINVLAEGRYTICEGCGDFVDAGYACPRAAKRRAEIERGGGKVKPTGMYNVTLEGGD